MHIDDIPTRPSVQILTNIWVDGRGTALLIIDDALHVQWLNLHAEIALRDRSFFEIRDDHLTVSESIHLNDLEAFVARCDRVLSSCCFDAIGGHVILRGIEAHRDYSCRLLVLEIIDTRACQPAFCELEKAFQLTKREAHILLRLLDADTPDDIARADKLSVATVRAHIRSVYQKMNVSCREELFRKVMPFHVSERRTGTLSVR